MHLWLCSRIHYNKTYFFSRIRPQRTRKSRQKLSLYNFPNFSTPCCPAFKFLAIGSSGLLPISRSFGDDRFMLNTQRFAVFRKSSKSTPRFSSPVLLRSENSTIRSSPKARALSATVWYLNLQPSDLVSRVRYYGAQVSSRSMLKIILEIVMRIHFPSILRCIFNVTRYLAIAKFSPKLGIRACVCNPEFLIHTRTTYQYHLYDPFLKPLESRIRIRRCRDAFAQEKGLRKESKI